MMFLLPAGPADCGQRPFALIEVARWRANWTLHRMNQYAALRRQDCELRRVDYWDCGPRWFSVSASELAELCGKPDVDCTIPVSIEPDRQRSLRTMLAVMHVTDALVWWSCLDNQADRTLTCSGLTRADLLPLTGTQDHATAC